MCMYMYMSVMFTCVGCTYMCASVMFALWVCIYMCKCNVCMCVCIYVCEYDVCICWHAYVCECDVYMDGCAYMCERAMFSYVGMFISSHVYRGHRRMPGPVLSLSTLFPWDWITHWTWSYTRGEQAHQSSYLHPSQGWNYRHAGGHAWLFTGVLGVELRP